MTTDWVSFRSVVKPNIPRSCSFRSCIFGKSEKNAAEDNSLFTGQVYGIPALPPVAVFALALYSNYTVKPFNLAALNVGDFACKIILAPSIFGELKPYNSKYSSNFVLFLACS